MADPMSARTIAPEVSAGPYGLPRLLVSPDVVPLAEHLDRYGPVPRRVDLIGEVDRSGLRGRGGAAFPTAVKMAAVARGRRPIVVANGTEGEPASRKDKTLMVFAPHLAIDGAVLAARAVGAREAVICVDRAATQAVRAVGAALREREAAGVDPIPVRLALTPDRYLTGEESALVNWLNGGDAKPTFVPPRPYEKGVGGRATLVQNVETLANIALIARFGSGWFRTVGTTSEPGSVLVTVSGGVREPGVYEVPLGTPMGEVLRYAGLNANRVSAVLVGGYFGSWLPAGLAGTTPLDVESLSKVGASLGAGVLVALPEDQCGLAESARVARWLAGQTAGQCGPCVYGLDAIAGAMEALVDGRQTRAAMQHLTRWLQMVEGRGACKHPDGAARFVNSALRVFADEVERHRRGGPCPGSHQRALLPTPAPGGWR
jgi:NADH:ubiquinone oxidoreductase subunit F (NADH-binding)